MDNVLVTGGKGLLGSRLPFGKKLGRDDLDVTSSDSVHSLFEKEKPAVVVHLAALDIRQSEADPDLAHKVHVGGTENVAHAALSVGARVVYLSTGAVFSGSKEASFDETSAPAPLNVYGEMKSQAEKRLLEISSDALVIRSGWVFGMDSERFFDRVCRNLKEGLPVEASEDTVGSPTFSKDLAEAIRLQIEERATGVLHLINSERATPIELVSEMKRLLKSESRIQPTQGQVQSMPRSASEHLVSNRYRLRSWREAVADWLS